jgi:hypothetical protein
LLAPVNSFDRVSEPTTSPRLDFNERDRTLSLHDEIDVTVAATKSALHYTPALSLQPPLRDPLSQFAKRLPGR